MKYKTYREIQVSERLPEFEGIHTVVDVELNMFQAIYDKEFGFNSEFEDCSGITHWIEPFELPTKQEIDFAADEYTQEHQFENPHVKYLIDLGFKEGAKYIINTISENE